MDRNINFDESQFHESAKASMANLLYSHDLITCMETTAKNIQMVDLGGQYLKIKKEIDLAIQGVIDSCAFINGPEVKTFQKDLEKYLGVTNVIPCANGTDALQIAMMGLGLKPGDEVITANFTYVATAEVIALLGLKPKLVDVDPHTFNIDCKALRKAITPATKAIVPVHLYGQCADMEEIMKIADEWGLFVIEDTAQAIGADYSFKNGKVKKAGTVGHVGCTSFFPSKNLGCYGDGGAIFTNDNELAGKIRMIANHGQRIQYYHDEIGVNSRLDSIQAAILRIKLKHLDTYAMARNQVAKYYDNAFLGHPNLITPVRNINSTHVFHQYTLQVINGDRNKLKEYLGTKGIPAMIYYPLPLHLQKAFEDPKYKDGEFPITERLCNSVISLPIHTEMDQASLEIITSSVLDFFKK